MQVSQNLGLSNIYRPISNELKSVKEGLLKQLRDAFDLIRGIGFEKTVVEGKQIRPALALLAGMSVDQEKGSELIDVAVASEMTHFASLIHDDVVDGATVRRGVASVNARWHDKVAVLLGDYIIAQALHILSEYRNTDVMQTMMSAIKDMSEGELHQITTRSEGVISEDDYYSVIRRKTSSLMGAVCAMPVQIISGSREAVKAMRGFGYNFGMAFQIVDDLLDFIADQEKLGKPILCDIGDGKATLPTICLLKRTDKSDNERVRRILRERNLDEDDKKWLCESIRSNGADEYCLDAARDFSSRAKRALEVFPDSEHKNSMTALCDYIVTRER